MLVVGAGFLGAHIVEAFVRTGVPVRVLTRRPLDGARGDRVAGARLILGDANDGLLIGRALAGVGTVVFSAGGLRPAESELDPLGDLRITIPPLLTVLDALREQPGPALVYLSSGGTIYGEPDLVPVPESAPLRPTGSYDTLKVTAERYLELYRRRLGVRSVALRCANAYGEDQPSHRSQGVVASVVDAALSGRALPVYGDGRATRDYVHVSDVAEAVVGVARLLEQAEVPPALNVGSGIGTSIHELIAVVEEVVGPVRVEDHPARLCDVARVVLDIAALRRVMRFDPIELREGITRVAAARASVLALA